MAKGKSTNSVSRTSASASKRATPASSDGRRTAAAAKPAIKAQRALSNEDIGHVAGEVWGVLNSGGEHTVADIKKSVGASADLIAAAIGWLAREDKLVFATSGRTVKISLR